MTAGSWPYIPEQCPHCVYIYTLPPFQDDSGYEIRGFCRHPLIAMELFTTQRRELSGAERCRLFAPEATSPARRKGA